MNRLATKIFISALIVTNILTAGFLILGREETKVADKTSAGNQQQSKSESSFKDNPSYVERMSLYSVYGKQGKIVMLGNSITERVDWAELLNRDDIINRGIGSDITEGFLSRMEYIYKVNPKVCYIMGGVNDIARNVPQDITILNIKKIIEDLKQHNITPVLQSVLHVADIYPNNVVFNQKIESMNVELEKAARETKVCFLNLNAILSSDNQLIKEYVLKDGIHLNGQGYDKWRTVLLANLKEQGL
ncbi:MAG: GDSL-type esterase/lipase family protein [Bacteroidales bacterium]|nr:GDSL-type esterase/lipase family protein [Bacteroidales bacterium]